MLMLFVRKEKRLELIGTSLVAWRVAWASVEVSLVQAADMEASAVTVPPSEDIAEECMVMVGVLVAIQPVFKTRGRKATVLKSMMKTKKMGRQVGDMEQLHRVLNVR
jgi:hypothetical protein